MRRGKKLFALLLVLTLVFAVLTGCGNTGTANTSSTSKETAKPTEAVKPVTIRYGLWGSDEEIKLQKQDIETINKENPNIKIEIQVYPDSTTFWNKLPAEIAAKTAPDIVKITNEGYFEYVSKGMIAPIDNEVKQANVDLSQLSKASLAIWTVDGKLYGIPRSVAPAMFFINKDMWKAAGLGAYPKTWDEVKTAAKALTKDGVYGICINNMEYHITQYALSFGGGWNNGKTINADGNVKALEYIFDMYKQKVAVTPKQLGFGWDGEVFANKKAAMSTGGWWYIGYLKGAAPDLNYEILPIPEGSTKGCTMHSDAIVVLKDATDKVAAAKACGLLSRADAQKLYMEGVGSIPSIPSLADKYYEVNPATKSTKPETEYAKDFGYPKDTKKFSDTLVQAVEEKILNNGTKSAKEILDDLQKQFQ